MLGFAQDMQYNVCQEASQQANRAQVFSIHLIIPISSYTIELTRPQTN